ncbi:hypothetical protein B0H17DRAFT_1173539 [Mycena rosella]|uniref:Uncharacterized protein n=1 Tax=Mycena rosella TaxID=1033263 RepID=A0AAD7H2L7_MYCRO|nr:hypothetical protein B0H17DRAFT_1173539 [Mycena rosella]
MEKQQLAPDPGPQRRTSKSVSPLGCLHAVLVVFGASGLLLVMWIAGRLNETWDQVTNRSTVARPLLSAEDRFDIIATVWLRGNASQQAGYQADRYPDAASEVVEDSKDTHFHREIRLRNPGTVSPWTAWSDMGVRPTAAQDDVFEVTLYSGVIIQNATLSDKEIELANQLGAEPTTEHLRASFVVSPSVKMDHLRNFSSWMPDYVLETQWRSRPASPTEQKSLIDRAIDSFSLSVPMVEFHPIMSHCDAILNAAGFTNTTPAYNQPWGSNASRHPHVTSRVHLRILNEQHLFNLTAYNTVHNKLRRTSSKCGLGYNLGKSPGLPHRSVCLRTYEDVSPMETRLEFSDSHHGETEWAYAPFLSAALNAAGPLDQIPVPVNRVNCSAQASYNSTNLPVLEPSLLNDTMKVIWHISFSGRTPRKMLLSDLTAFAPVINASQSELERIEEQVWFEPQNTLRGHRFHVDSHPRRRLVASTLGLTVGISIRGQWLSTAGFLAWAVELMFNSSDFVEKIVLGCVYIFLSVFPLFAIARMELSWRGFTRLPATFAHATHAERASSRIDARSSWRFIGMSMLILAMCLFLADPYQRNLIPSPLPPDPEMTKATVWLAVAERVLHFTSYLPAILGHIPDREPLSVGTIIDVLPLLVRAWQAWTLPAAKTEEEEEPEN